MKNSEYRGLAISHLYLIELFCLMEGNSFIHSFIQIKILNTNQSFHNTFLELGMALSSIGLCNMNNVKILLAMLSLLWQFVVNLKLCLCSVKILYLFCTQ